MSGMDAQYIIDHLPVNPDDGVKAFVKKNSHELGGFVTLFKRIHIRELPDDLLNEPCGTSYVGECWCSECQSVWHTAWGGDKSVIVADGDGGMIYPLSSHAAAYGADLTTRMSDGSTGICPMCGEGVTFRHVSKFGTRQMTRRMFMVFRRIGEFTVLVSWLACREIYLSHEQYFEIVPWIANVIDEQGRLRAFRYNRDLHRWHRSSNPVDPETTGYISGEGSYGYVRGGFIEIPQNDLGGQTGEKTGVREYLDADGCFPTHYLRVWRRHRNIENLMKTGFSQIAAKLVNNDASVYYTNSFEGLDFSKTKPHEIAGMNKADFKVLCAEGWSHEMFSLWRACKAAALVDTAAKFSGYFARYKATDIRRMVSMSKKLPGLTMAKLDRYLTERQGLRPVDLHLLEDVWRMHQQVHLHPPRTEEEWWPRNLMDAHDRLAMMVSLDSSDSMQQSFNRTAELLRPLMWTDGELCIVIPRSPADLAHEGRVLRHCVGGYSKSHVSGSPIFFIRHYRRPERPYYTLNICLTTPAPTRSQLHGYGNERHGDKKQYPHGIPKKVLDFCDRWEQEILMPWWIAHQRNEVTA